MSCVGRYAAGDCAGSVTRWVAMWEVVVVFEGPRGCNNGCILYEGLLTGGVDGGCIGVERGQQVEGACVGGIGYI